MAKLTIADLAEFPVGTILKSPNAPRKSFTRLPREGFWFVRDGVYLSHAELLKATDGDLTVSGTRVWG